MEKTSHETRLRSHKGSCDACIYCSAKADAARPGITLICRFNPPQTHAVLAMVPQVGPAWQVACVWPQVEKDDWCSEFTAQTN
jgi:hypothetical protein